MKKTAILMMVVLATMVSTMSANQNQNSLGNKFQRTLKANQQFPNPDLVYPGDTVMVPVIIQAKSIENGYDCIWKASQRGDLVYLEPTQPEKTDSITTQSVPVAKKTNAGPNWWIIAILVLSALALIVALFGAFRNNTVVVVPTVGHPGAVPIPAATSAPTPVTTTINVSINIAGGTTTVNASGSGNTTVNVNVDVNGQKPA